MSKSLFRYPGGKSKKARELVQYFKTHEVIVSPFLGGGSVELMLADMGKVVISSDIDEHLINCWSVATSPLKDEMYIQSKAYFDFFHSGASFDDKREQFIDMRTLAELPVGIPNKDVHSATCYWIVNRISFSGLGLKGGFSFAAIKAEFGPGVLERLKCFKPPECFHTPVCRTWEQTLLQYNKEALFLDPPYYMEKGFVYPHHAEFNHVKLATYLLDSDHPFLMTYNNEPRIWELYGGKKDIEISEETWFYPMTSHGSSPRQGKELFITRHLK